MYQSMPFYKRSSRREKKCNRDDDWVKQKQRDTGNQNECVRNYFCNIKIQREQFSD